jgi:hypothetical protein
VKNIQYTDSRGVPHLRMDDEFLCHKNGIEEMIYHINYSLTFAFLQWAVYHSLHWHRITESFHDRIGTGQPDTSYGAAEG